MNALNVILTSGYGIQLNNVLKKKLPNVTGLHPMMKTMIPGMILLKKLTKPNLK
jgi:hypothetical protein